MGCQSRANNEGDKARVDELMTYPGPWSAAEFAKIGRWTVWRFKTDFKIDCAAAQSVEDTVKTWPIAVYYGQSTGDLRINIALDGDKNPRAFIPQGKDIDNNDPNFRGYVKLPDQQFFVPIDSVSVFQFEGKTIEVRPAGNYPLSFGNRSIDLSGITKVVHSLRACAVS